jgi:hypothetical protein
MGKMNKILSEERKQDSALDAFLEAEAKHEEEVGDELLKASPEVKKALKEVASTALGLRAESEETVEEQVTRVVEGQDTLADRGYLVSVHMTQYTSQVPDKEVAEEVALAKNAEEGVVTVKKDLLPNCSALKDINKLCAQIRKAHGKLTLPWEDRGDRLVPNLDFMFKYWEWKKGIKKDYEKAKNLLDATYDLALQKTHLTQGDLYDPSAYLTKEEVLAKFTLTFTEKNVPEGDLRVVTNEELSEDMASMVKEAQANALVQQERKMARVSMQAWDTLLDPLCNMIIQLRDENHDGSLQGFSYRKQKDGSYKHGDPKKPQYKSTLTTNVISQVDMLAAWFETVRGMNTDHDDAVDTIVKLANTFRHIDAEILKEDNLLRTRTRECALKMLREVPKEARDTNMADALKQKQTVTVRKKGEKPKTLPSAAKQRVDLLGSL